MVLAAPTGQPELVADQCLTIEITRVKCVCCSVRRRSCMLRKRDGSFPSGHLSSDPPRASWSGTSKFFLMAGATCRYRTALAISCYPLNQTGMSTKKTVNTLRPIRSVKIIRSRAAVSYAASLTPRNLWARECQDHSMGICRRWIYLPPS